MGELQPVADLRQQFEGIAGRNAMFVQHLRKVLTLHPLHGDEQDTLILTEFIDGDQVGVIEHARRLGLAGKPELRLIPLGD